MSQNINRLDGLYLQDGRYEYEFEENDIPIREGSYEVFKAKNRIDDKDYAIKKIKISSAGEYLKKRKELRIWAKLDCDHFIQYRTSWLETLSTDPKVAILHIQMDLYLFTLKDAMINVNKELNIPQGSYLTKIGYYIASELLMGILEGINYLHKKNIIHRDLRPENIFIKNGTNIKCIKIGDFGASTIHEFLDQSHTQLKGNLKYTANEVLNGRNYDTKADIYSIGVITQEMFNVDINKPDDSVCNDSLLKFKYENLLKLINDCMSITKKLRPNCDLIMSDKNLWALDFNEVSAEVKSIVDSDAVYVMEKNFVHSFLQSKLRDWIFN